MINEEKLFELYIEQEMSGTEIAEKIGCSSSTVYNYLEEYGIQSRGKSECQNKIEIAENVLKEKYIDKEKSCSEIAEEYDCTAETITRRLKEYNIPRREKTYKLEEYRGRSLSEETKEKLSKSVKKSYENGREHWNKGGEHSEETKRKISQTLTGRYRAEENPNWKGGRGTRFRTWKRRIIDSYKYKQFRLEAYERDDYSCELCGKDSDGDLELHHIIPVNKKPELIMKIDNVATLCQNCHRSIRHKEEKFAEELTRSIKNE